MEEVTSEKEISTDFRRQKANGRGVPGSAGVGSSNPKCVQRKYL